MLNWLDCQNGLQNILGMSRIHILWHYLGITANAGADSQDDVWALACLTTAQAASRSVSAMVALTAWLPDWSYDEWRDVEIAQLPTEIVWKCAEMLPQKLSNFFLPQALFAREVSVLDSHAKSQFSNRTLTVLTSFECSLNFWSLNNGSKLWTESSGTKWCPFRGRRGKRIRRVLRWA